MLWKFSFASSSNVDTLLTRDNPPELEEVLDEQDILSELKSQNKSLITYLSKEDHIKSLLQWVVAGLDELDQAAEKSDSDHLQHAISSTHIYPSIQMSPVPAPPPGPGSPPLEPAKMVDEDGEKKEGDETPYSPELPAALGQGLGNDRGADDAKRARYPIIATEILTSDLWTVPETIMAHKDNLLRPFWDAVLSTVDQNPPATDQEISDSRHDQSEKDRARDEFWSEEDEERHRKRETIRGLWTRVNGKLLEKRPLDMVWFIQTIPNVVERLVNRIESPAIQDLFVRLITTEHQVQFGVIEWLAEQGLVNRLIDLLSPESPPTLHVIAADLLKGIVSVCAPAQFEPSHVVDEQAGPGGPGSKNNLLIRQMVSEESIAKMTGYMLDDIELSDKDWKGINGEGAEPSPADPFVVHPLPSIASASSSLSQVCSVLVELIRRNNADYSEPHLFHTLRTRLMTLRDQQLRNHAENGRTSAVDAADRDAMEDAMEEISPKMGIVHLGRLLTKIIDRFGDLHRFFLEPRSLNRASSSSAPKPLTNERFRIIEIYAELLHSSNMLIFNRPPGSGPTYSTAGVLSGGIDSLEALGVVVSRGGDDGKEPTPDPEVTQARELPVSAGSTDVSISGSSDIGSDDEAVLDAANEGTPSQSPAASRTLDDKASASANTDDANPPPPSQADVARLRDLRDSEPTATGAATSDMASVSHAAVAASTTAPSVASDHPTEGGRAPVNPPTTKEDHDDLEMSLGDRLKSKYLQYSVIPSLIDIFFTYPNNNFAHHVIYDLLQQILNGRLVPGLNRELVIEIIKEGRLVERVLDAQRANDRLTAQPRQPRLPHMGHVFLIAEELVKFFINCPDDLMAIIGDSFNRSEWEAFITGPYSETRARDAKPLAGGKPMQTGPTSDVAPGARSDDSSDEEDEAALGDHKFGEPLTRTKAKDGYAQGGDSYESYEDRNESGDDDENYWRGMSESRRHVDSSDDDDDDDADWLRPSVRNAARGGDIGSDDDDFAGFQSGSSRVQHLDDFDDDDAWGNFSNAGPSQSQSGGDSANANPGANPFDDFRPDPLTPHDWASEFDREFNHESWASPNADADADADADEEEEEEEESPTSGDAPTIVMPTEDDDGADADAENFSPRPGSTWSFSGDDEGEDLPPTTSPTMEDTPRMGTTTDAGAKAEGETPKTPPQPPTKAMSGLSLTAPRDASGQLRRSPPPPPPSRSTKPSASAPTGASIVPTAPPSVVDSVASESITLGAPLDVPPTNAGLDPIPDRTPAGIDIPTSTSTSLSPKRSVTAPSLEAQAFSPPEASLIQATSPSEPLGPGVSSDTTVMENGMVQREVDGEVITVPADEIVRGVEDAMDRQSESEAGEGESGEGMGSLGSAGEGMGKST